MNQLKLFFFTVLALLMFSVTAQTKIGDAMNTIDPSSLLELEHPTKALYLTRVSLTSTTDVATVPSPKAGMIVYNSNAAITATTSSPKLGGGVGIYYFDGTSWVGAGPGEHNGDFWRILGNVGTVDGTHFLGTTDDVPMNFGVNSQKAGRIGNSTDQNVFLGYQSGNVNTAIGNHFIGHQAGYNNTTGTQNHFMGYQAGFLNISSSQNHFDGYQAGYNNLTGTANTFISHYAGFSNTSGSKNTAAGYYTLYNNTTGESNVALGGYTLHYNQSGSNNVAFGDQTLLNNSSGNYNTGAGDQALKLNSTGNKNTAMGSVALTANTIGNNNAAFGNRALYNNESGSRNTAIGRWALQGNYIDHNNCVGIGHRAGFSNSTSGNHFEGSYAGLNTGAGTSNTLLGFYSGQMTSTGTDNTTTGHNTLTRNRYGSFIAAYGSNALNGNGDNYSDVDKNVAFGYNALWRTITGTNNVSFGYDAGNNITTGGTNIMIGAGALSSTATAYGEIIIGNSSNTSFRTYGNLFPADDNIYTLGSSSKRWTEVYATNGTINTSDARMKKNVRSLAYGLDAVMKMRPVLYDWKNDSGTDKIGFIAQELRIIVPNVVVGNESKETLGVMYSDLIPVLAKAMQEQEAPMQALKQDKQTQATNIRLLTEEVASLRLQYTALAAAAVRVKLLEQALSKDKQIANSNTENK